MMMSGFGNEFATEALPGALPQGRNSPQRPAHGLYAEQFSATPFTVPRTEARRTWLYRIRPSANHPPNRPRACARQGRTRNPSPKSAGPGRGHCPMCVAFAGRRLGHGDRETHSKPKAVAALSGGVKSVAMGCGPTQPPPTNGTEQGWQREPALSIARAYRSSWVGTRRRDDVHEWVAQLHALGGGGKRRHGAHLGRQHARPARPGRV